MRIKVTLHSILRDRLPPDARGRTELEVPDGATLNDAVLQLAIPDVLYAVNGSIERNLERPLRDGDELDVFIRAAGG